MEAATAKHFCRATAAAQVPYSGATGMALLDGDIAWIPGASDAIHTPKVDHCKLQPRQCWQPAEQQVEQTRTVMFHVSGMSELLTCKVQ